MSVHELKTWPEYFAAVASGAKPFEVRQNDRGFEVGDRLRLREWNRDEKAYTGRVLEREVCYILRGPAFGIKRGWCVMGFRVRRACRLCRSIDHFGDRCPNNSRNRP